ncbi:MAG: polysaccharide deacetylase family protein, partial [Clostridia bacterium]|nr:polysaccharide deacetylase family protein [Clostridia bacterium]
YGAYTLSAPAFYGYYNGYSSALTMTFDDGYDIGTGQYINSIYRQYGFRGTAMLGVTFLQTEDENNNKIDNDWLISEWNEVLAEGYLDVGCHGYDHLNPVGLSSTLYEHEIKDAIYYLREKFPTQRVLTYVTPFAHIDESYKEYLNDYAISNRLEADGKDIKIGESYDLYKVKSTSILAEMNAAGFNTSIGNALKQKGRWTVELYHCVRDNASGRDATKTFFAEHCKYIYDNFKDTTWVASFEDVSVYLKQLENSTINYVSSDRESMTLSINCSLDKDIYNFPMTIKVQVPGTVTSAYTVINGEEQTLEVIRGSGVNAVVVKNAPANGEPVKIYFGGNNVYNNSCPHNYIPQDAVAPTCGTHGYTPYKCSRCGAAYKTNFTSPLGHDFTGEREAVKTATELEDGLDKIKCKTCNKYKEIPTKFGNVAKYSVINTSEGINEWTYSASMVDDDLTTGWICGTSAPEISFAFNSAKISSAEITFFREYAMTQGFKVHALIDGEWTELHSWSSEDDESGDSQITVTIDIEKRMTGIKFCFEGTSEGCTNVKEIALTGVVDK